MFNKKTIIFFQLNSPANKLFVKNCHYKKLQLDIITEMFIYVGLEELTVVVHNLEILCFSVKNEQCLHLED